MKREPKPLMPSHWFVPDHTEPEDGRGNYACSYRDLKGRKCPFYDDKERPRQRVHQEQQPEDLSTRKIGEHDAA